MLYLRRTCSRALHLHRRTYRRNQRERVVNTLDSRKHTAHDILDLSSVHDPYIFLPYIEGNPRIHLPAYQRGMHSTRLPTPPNTRGFLYFHSPAPERIPEAAELRFRLFNSTATANPFAPPQDLLMPTHTPYALPLLAIVASRQYHPLGGQLLKEGLVTPAVVSSCLTIVANKKSGALLRSPIIHSLHQPFFLDFTKAHHTLFLLGHHRLEHMRLRLNTLAPRDDRPKITAGSALVSFERASALKPRTLVLRIREVLEPLYTSPPPPKQFYDPPDLCPQSPEALFFPEMFRFPTKVWSAEMDQELQRASSDRRFLRLLLPEPLEKWEMELLDKE